MLMDSIFEKLSKNQTLSDLERSEYLSFMTRLQSVVQTSENQTESSGAAKLKDPVIENPRWRSSPLHPISVNMQVDVEVANNGNPFITFDNVSIISEVFGIAEDFQKVLVLTPGQYMVKMGGRNVWEANANGYRNMELVAYDENDVVIGAVALQSDPGQSVSGGVDNYFPWTLTFDQNFFTGIKYFKFRVFQDSGSAIDLKTVNIGIHIC